jgi:hypothetical protein
MKKPIPPELKTPVNAEILKELEGQSCHSDIVEPIQSHLSKLEGVKVYCPDGKNFSYFLWYVNSVVFAYASGMQKVNLRLSQSGELSLNEAKYPKSYKVENSWYAIPYNSEMLSVLVNSAYESAKNS